MRCSIDPDGQRMSGGFGWQSQRGQGTMQPADGADQQAGESYNGRMEQKRRVLAL